MKFNQVIWDALCYAVRSAVARNAAPGFRHNMVDALDQYAADCDGAVQTIQIPGQPVEYRFIPNPIPKY